ncbi:MAG: alpha-1,4-glucan--maltose-1-phosphate maltosyltransferase [archaeon]|nr:alpha-1,4-glucan--maltose-1-phosphate maltosyltransferase [archaeon]
MLLFNEGRKRVVIENVKPEINCGDFPIKRVVGEKVVVQADIFSDSHDVVSARLLYRKSTEPDWKEVEMRYLENDRWEGEFVVKHVGTYRYTLIGMVNHFKTWQQDLQKKLGANQDIKADMGIGIDYINKALERAEIESDKEMLREFGKVLKEIGSVDVERAVSVALSEELTSLMEKYSERQFVTIYEKELEVVVDRKKALFSTWYELFPRSCSSTPVEHGTFKDCEKLLPELMKMGFDLLYLPPINPIGRTNRKGKNNSPISGPDDPGTPWAIGSEEGGHKAIHSQLGTFEDLERLVNKAREYGIEIALDLAFQCSPDHPYLKEHPEWFRWRPDGTVHYAENPPKKYEDVIPFFFETENWQGLWEELKSIVYFWIDKGIRIFRVDNPHTKPFKVWEWLIREVKKDYPDVIFLSEAFTRPKVMYQLAKVGFTQSYTYYTWRNTKKELIEYLTELTQTDVKEYFRPNFWPNTPDILPEYLQYGGRPAFIIRLVLAATLSSNYGIYGPAYELCVNKAIPGKEEYLNSEKYEIKYWDKNRPENLKEFIARVNKIRRENPSLQTTWNLRFYENDNENMICYGKATEDLSNIILVVVNLDPFHTQSGWLRVPIEELGIELGQPYLVHDLLGDDKYIWQGEWNYVELDPNIIPARIFKLKRRMRREKDFDYFM